MSLIRRGITLNDRSNRKVIGETPIRKNSANIEGPDLRQLERNLRKIDGVSRKDAKKICNKVRAEDWQQNLDERDAERKGTMKDYMQPQRDVEAKLNTYTEALCDAELQMKDEYEAITQSILLSDYIAFNTQQLLGKYNEH